METSLQPLNRIQQKLVNITLAWEDYEEDMGENAALEVACQEEGVDSDWYYNNFAAESDVVNAYIEEVYGEEVQ